MKPLSTAPQLRVIARGVSPHAEANLRGHLFEKLISEVLRRYGYEIDRKPSVNYAGMEIDIEGHDILSGVPLYAECKCYDTSIDSPKFQAFYGKYMTRWLRESRCRGLFLAIPGVNSHAKGFYKENCTGTSKTTVTLLEQDDVVNAIIERELTVDPSVLRDKIPVDVGVAGDQILLYTEHGLIWVQFVVPRGGAMVSGFVLFDAKGTPISDGQTIEYVQETCSDVSSFSPVAIEQLSASGGSIGRAPGSQGTQAIEQDSDQVVEVRGSSAWFEYQFPASPEYFVGRSDVLADVSNFASAVLAGTTSARGLLFTGNSGWGKSSAVLAAASLLRKQGHSAVVIDCRSISSARTILRVVDFALHRVWGDDPSLLHPPIAPLTGFEGAAAAAIAISDRLKHEGRLSFLFLDQFENIFFLPEALKRIRDLLFKMCDEQANFILGFAWKTDLVGATNDFPFQLRDAISDSSRRIALETFSDVETNALLDKLKVELRTNLRKDLRFFLSEFSQGYPWLLKKLCAHVKAQREDGVAQSEIASRLLNIEQLFREDIGGLTPQQEDTLRRIAKVAPVGISDISEHYGANVVQSLVDSRLVVQIGNKFDVYWDIFRDYLNTGQVPVQENYLLRVQIGTILKTMREIVRAGGEMDLGAFRSRTHLSEHSAMNVVRDLRLLGLANPEAGRIKSLLEIRHGSTEAEILETIRAHTGNHLAHNRLVSRISSELKAEGALDLGKVAEQLAAWCPYVTATPSTWREYARILASWMDLADLTTYDKRAGSLEHYEYSAGLRRRDLNIRAISRSGVIMPAIQYSPVERVYMRIIGAFAGRRVNWNDFKKSTLQKAFATLEALGFLVVSDGSFRLVSQFFPPQATEQEAKALFAAAALKMPAFEYFLGILRDHGQTRVSLLGLGKELREKLAVDWRDGTAQVNAKILLDWARHTGLAPATFAARPRRRRNDTGQGRVVG